MNTMTRTELQKELIVRGFSEKGAAPNKTMSLKEEELSVVSVGDLLDQLMSRHERIFRSMGFATGEEAKPFWDDLAAAIDAIKAIIQRAADELEPLHHESTVSQPRAPSMSSKVKDELQKELIARGYAADGHAPQGSMWLVEDFLRSVQLVELIDTLFSRREKLFRMVEEEGMEPSRPSYDDVSIAVEALKVVVSHLFGDD